MMKKCILWFVACLAFVWLSFAHVSVNPVYTSERFHPSDKFHAGCENQIDVVFQLDNSKINWINAFLHYQWNKVEILRIVANWEKENNLQYTVENDKIIFSKLKSDWEWLSTVTFSVFFRSLDGIELSNFYFEKGSYIVDSKWNMIELEWDYDFEFVEVPECDPDIVAPSVELLFPSNKSWEYVALDSYFQFEINDAWKWVNEESVKIKIDWFEYTLQEIEHDWNGNVLSIYPDFWMPFNTDFEVEISVSDKQSYGKPNTMTKIYNFQTSDELNLLGEIDPIQFRKIVNMEKYFKWTAQECELLAVLYSTSDEYDWALLQSINQRLSCWNFDNVKKTWKIDVVENLEVETWKDFSVFAMLWWILFGSSALFWIFLWLRK